jgi:predicted amidophosphoribosyltransferase
MFFPPACFCCGAYFQLQLGLCPVCFDQSIRPQIQTQTATHLWMSTWHNQRHAWMSKWAMSFKGNRSALWQKAAILTASHFLSASRLSHQTRPNQIYIVDPSQKQDHSFWYAHHLSQVLSAQHLPFFFVKNSPPIPQKELSLLARKTLSQNYAIRDTHSWAELRQDKNIIWLFVDDVVTSGATWESCYQLLTKPASFYVISWLKRERLGS